jgi:pyruvate/2-oxoglutarate dehydrogenase complex dihydrolipoamide acyltransferase (E2) component
MAIKEVLVPDIGNFDSVDVIEVHVKAGDSVNQDDSLITLESDKASMDIPSPFSGTVKEVKIKVGDKAAQGVLIALVESAEGAAEASRPAAAAVPVVTSVAAAEIPPPSKPVPEVPSPSRPKAHPTRSPPAPNSRRARIRTPARRCASSRANWVPTFPASPAAAPRGASARKTCRPGSRAN